MFWAACNLGYFAFLRSDEFTVPNLASFFTALHLGVQDIAVDSDANPSCLRIRIKAAKTDPFCKGCFVHTRQGRFPLSGLPAVILYLSIRANWGGPLFLLQDGWPLSCPLLTSWIQQIMVAVVHFWQLLKP